MIVSFKHKGLKRFFETGSKKGIQPKHADRLALILDLLAAAADIRDMDFPGSDLHLLEPKQDGVWAVKVSGNWRLTFVFENGEAHQVNYLDYH
ncbi:MAG: type II toxin-antitoxin system RelE/ParE family toxin [Anaerolineae bacterium]